jgi:hypothetical protein
METGNQRRGEEAEAHLQLAITATNALPHEADIAKLQ